MFKSHFTKNMRLFTIIIGFLLIGLNATAQNNGRITGNIIDKELKEAIPEANIRVLHQKDSTFYNGVATDNEGRFSITLPYGSYIIHVTYVGNNDVYQNVVLNKDKPRINLGTIELGMDNILLSEAVITAKAAEIVVKGDTVEYNADSYKVTESAILED